MPASDFDPDLLSEDQLIGECRRWPVFVRYDGQRYGFGTFLHYADAHHACTPSALEKALGSPDKRAARQVAG